MLEDKRKTKRGGMNVRLFGKKIMRLIDDLKNSERCENRKSEGG